MLYCHLAHENKSYGARKGCGEGDFFLFSLWFWKINLSSLTWKAMYLVLPYLISALTEHSNGMRVQNSTPQDFCETGVELKVMEMSDSSAAIFSSLWRLETWVPSHHLHLLQVTSSFWAIYNQTIYSPKGAAGQKAEGNLCLRPIWSVLHLLWIVPIICSMTSFISNQTYDKPKTLDGTQECLLF